MPKKLKTSPSIKQIRSLVLLAITALLAGVTLSYLINKPEKPPTLLSATLYPENFRPIPDFNLRDQNNKPFTKASLRDSWSLVFFGFTHCPDVCPNTLNLLNQVSKLITQKNVTAPRVIFVSVDPERDTTDRLKPYIDYFNPDFIGLRGDKPQLEKITRAMGVFYSKRVNENNPQEYQVDHSAGIFLVNPQGRLSALFSTPHDAEKMTSDILKIQNHTS